MADKSALEGLHEVKILLQTLQNEWAEALEDWAIAREEIKNEDLFTTIDYLTICDELSQSACVYVKEIDPIVQDLEHRKKSTDDKKQTETLEFLSTHLQELKTKLLKTIQDIHEEYVELSEETLRRSQDVIGEFSEAMQQEKVTLSLKAQINQNPEKEIFLQELRDSLEAYRHAREDFISELELPFIQQLPESAIPEDLGEERPEMDSVLSQLDTAITACDTALLIKDITE
jgi:hypothetical protein